MSDKDLEQENIIENEEVVVQDDEQLDEVKASFGDPSEVPDPQTKENTPPGAKPNDADKNDNPKQGSSVPKTKVAMVTAAMDAMKKMSKSELGASYKKIMASLKVEGFDADEEAEDTAVSIKEIKKISSDDVDVSEDVSAMFNGEELSEEFVSKATTVFEAAIVSKVNEVLESVTVDMEAELEAEKEEIIESMTNKLDEYLEYVAEEWMEENKLAIEAGVKSEITENFMEGLRNLFAENYIDIPEEKVDLVDEMASKMQELETQVNEEMEKNIELKKQIAESTKDGILADAEDDLTESQAVKLRSLAEGVDFDDAESYKEKIDTLKENYFPKEEKEVITEELDDEPLEIDDENEVKVAPEMSAYMSAISKGIRK